MAIGLGAGLLTTVIGTALGMIAGWRGGWADALVRAMGDITLGIPLVVGAILLLSVLVEGERTPAQIIVTLALSLWPGSARIARSSVRSIVHLPYIEAARATGGTGTGWHILLRHVLPNSVPVVIAYATPVVGVLIPAESPLPSPASSCSAMH